MGLLYPRMRERPKEFRVNPNWPYYGNIVWAWLGNSSNRSAADEGPVQRRFDFAGGPTADRIVYHPPTRRFGIRFYGWNDERLRLPYRIEMTGPLTGIGLVDSFNYEALLIAGAGDYTVNGYVLLLYWRDRRAYLCRTGGTFVSNGVETIHLGPGSYAVTRDGSNTIRWYRDGILWGNTATLSGNTGGHAIGNFAEVPSEDHKVSGIFCDTMLFNVCLPDEVVYQLSDLNNVDLRVGGVPLVLPPRRRVWPVAVAAPAAGKTPWHLFANAGV